MNFITPILKTTNRSSSWVPRPYILQAVAYISLVAVDGTFVTETAATIPGTIPYFLLEGMTWDGRTINIISDGQNWFLVKKHYLKKKGCVHRLSDTPIQLTINDQQCILNLIETIFRPATQDC